MDHKTKIKENSKTDKYLDLAGELKNKQTNKQRKMKVTVIPIVAGATGTVSIVLEKRLGEQDIGGRIDTIQITTLLESARILWRVLEICCHKDFSGKQPFKNDDKTLQK